MMKTINRFGVSFVVVISFCLALSQGQSAQAAQRGIFDVQVQSAMNPVSGFGQAGGMGGWRYQWRTGMTNQSFEIVGTGLDGNQVYHLMGHFGGGTNLMHFADFAPDVHGRIAFNCWGGQSHLGNWTNQINSGWGMMNDSWVMFPPWTNNWCDVNYMGGGMMDATASRMPMMSGGGGMGDCCGMTNGWGGGGTNSWGEDWCWNGTNWWGGGTNWWMNTNSWSSLTNWCWGYTNCWNNWRGCWQNYTNWWTTTAPKPHHPMPLPGYASPIFALQDCLLVNDDLQPVLLANFGVPDSYGYRLRCGLINQGIVSNATAQLQITASPRSMHFRMSATGLAPSAGYYFAINGQAVTNITSDARGRCRLTGLPGGFTNVLSFAGMSVLDHNSNAVLSVTFPPQ